MSCSIDSFRHATDDINTCDRQCFCKFSCIVFSVSTTSPCSDNCCLLLGSRTCSFHKKSKRGIWYLSQPRRIFFWRRRTRELAALLLAVGIDPKEHVLFVQSHVPAHTELAWVLACNTQFGELSRMTQFKDKSAKHPDNVNGGLFTYPVLMAADILIYNADLVPVGQDQTQHLEIARDIAGRFNGIYGDTFTLPEGYVPAAGAKIMSLAEPTKKMSKSDTNVNSFILMTDDKDAIVRKFKRAVTDSDGVVRFDRETKPGVSNLMCIYSTFTGKSNDEIAAEFEGKGYGDFKLAVAEVTADALAPVQTEYARILADKAYVDEVLKNGAERASRLANRTVSKVYRKVGLLQLDK